MTCWQGENWSLGVHHNVWKAGWDVGRLWWCWGLRVTVHTQHFPPSAGPVSTLGWLPEVGCVFLDVWEGLKAFLVSLPTAEQCLAEHWAGCVGLGSLLLCRKFRWQFQVERSVRMEGRGWWGKGRRKWEESRLRGAEAAQWPLKNPLQCKKAQRCASATCSGRKIECDWPQLFWKKTQTTLTKVPKIRPKPKPLDRKSSKLSNQPVKNPPHTELSTKEREPEGGICFRLTSWIPSVAQLIVQKCLPKLIERATQISMVAVYPWLSSITLTENSVTGKEKKSSVMMISIQRLVMTIDLYWLNCMVQIWLSFHCGFSVLM